MKLFCSKKTHLALATIGFLLLFIAAYAAAPLICESADIESSTFFKLETRPGVELKFIVITPTNPVASVILLEGTPISLGLNAGFGGEPSVSGRFTKGFLTRTRKKFARNGLMVALVDVPSDREKLYTSFRMSSEHAQDIKAVVSHIKSEANIPVWLVGMSMGTFSAPNAAILLKNEIDGLVLVSSVTRRSKKWKKQIYDADPNTVLDMDLDQITVPTLIVHHRNDKCVVCPPSGAQEIREALVNSKGAEVMYFSGGRLGSGPAAKPCRALSAHGYYGIEDEVVKAIADFIKANSSSVGQATAPSGFKVQ